MPDNKNKGELFSDDINAYLDLLDEESGFKKKETRDFSKINENLHNEKPQEARKINIDEEEAINISRPVNRGLVNRSASSSQRPSSQRQPNSRPAPPRMKKNGQYVDIPKKQGNNAVTKWYYSLTKKKQRTVKALSVILVIIIIFGSALGIYVDNKFNMMGKPEDYTDVIYEEEEFSEISGNINASNFTEALKLWATTGNDEKMSSKNVVNVLLIGADSRKGTNTGNTDVMMLVSLNKKTKTIKLVSFMRDSYLYIEGANNSYCSKLNAAFSMGGPECLMRTLENNYKIEIDDFVMVNFESFKSIIEAMDGITVDVQKYEANYANNRYKLSMPYGDAVTLNGEEALAFCRIRGCDADGDVSRTRRQRQVINAMMDRVRNASISDLNNYLNALLPYIYTGFTKSEILSLGMKAITNGWAGYSRSELQIPTPETRTSGSMGSWIWVVDYQLAAQTLQTELYGESNIVLEDGRTTLIDIYNGTSGSGTSNGGGSTPVEDNNPDSTTLPETTNANAVPEESTDEFIDLEDMDVPDFNEEVTGEVTEEVPEDIESDVPEETTPSSVPTTEELPTLPE